MKRELRKNVYTDFAAFCEEIDRIIDSAATTNKGKFDSPIGEKVQLFDEYVKIDENTFSSPDRTKKEDKEEKQGQEQKQAPEKDNDTGEERKPEGGQESLGDKVPGAA